MKSLSDTGHEIIVDHVNSKRKLVGICLGFQILFEEGEKVAILRFRLLPENA